MRDADDNLIDWSAFDEEDDKPRVLQGSRELRIVSIILLLIAVAGIVMGGVAFNEALDGLNGTAAQNGTGLGSLVQPGLLVLFALLTIIPASFGLQTAKSPVVFMTPTVLGLLGIAASLVCAIALLVLQALAGEFDPVVPSYFIVCAAAACAYLFFVVRVHKAANAEGDVKHRPTKEELWDDKNVWG